MNVRHSARARRMTLRVSQLDGRATLTVPRGTSDRAARSFLNANAVWLERAQSKVPQSIAVGAGVQLLLEGQITTVETGSVKTAKIHENQIIAPRKDTAAAILIALKSAAKTRLNERVAAYAKAIGRTANRTTLRDPRSRWGSCSEAGNLMFSWRLIMAPPDVLNYVAAHEVAHLQEMNHSPAFWLLVRQIYPNYKAARHWLRSEGNRLHRYRFD